MKWILIVLMCVTSCVVYGIIHDQITARICVEYFTIGHPNLFGTESPTMLGFAWGILATWWVGLLLGIPLACASRLGYWPKIEPLTLVRPLALLMGCTFVIASIAGVIGWYAATKGWVFLTGNLAERVPEEQHIWFLTDLFAHNASYLTGFCGGVILIVSVIRKRRRRRAL